VRTFLTAALVLGGCAQPIAQKPLARTTPAAVAHVEAPVPVPVPIVPPAPLRASRVTLIAAGDVEMGRAMGQKLLKEPAHDPFATLAPLLATADIRFANLESQLSDQKGETMSPSNMLVFTGPPAGADAMARAGFTIVSTANNHAWDYGKRAAFETLDNLDRAGVLHVGTGRTREAAYAPLIVEKNGFRVAFLAVTDIWNQGHLETHEAAEYVARADAQTLAAQVAELKKDPSIDAVLVSYHGGDEYQDAPTFRTRAILRAAIDAGADAILGHHPHVIQGIEWRSGRPILYSMGNLLMQMHRDYPATGWGYLARLVLTRGEHPKLEVCPFRILGLTPLLFTHDGGRKAFEGAFFGRLRQVNMAVGAKTSIGPTGDDGCAPVTEGQ
jgi:poly-gamma-glutamate synthesis protein (capsule biosynthesis protein)